MTTPSSGTGAVRMGMTGIRELLKYNRWANERVLAACAPLSDAQLDRPFEMGLGAIRETVSHIAAAERVWLDRWIKHPAPRFRARADGLRIADISAEMREIDAERGEFVDRLEAADFERVVAFRTRAGEEHSIWLGGLMLHVCNHGTHHRAQLLNMLKQVGVKLPKPELDYIFMHLNNADEPPVEIDVATIRTYFAYSDWAMDRVLAAAAKLDDAALDRRFDMGVGTLRQTLLHIRFAEQWWVENWTLGPERDFPELPDNLPIADLVYRTAETRTARNAVLENSTDSDLMRFVEVRPAANIVKRFQINVSMLQMCCHGTHHRAQAINMLRHVGGEVPGVDVVVKLREK
ncbi:MAG: DinB family protein [Phycisphaerales bacterium]|nr:DinB family protein [Phycisphaerales bacterium]